MDDREDSVTAALERLAPVLGPVFAAYQISRDSQRAIVDEARHILSAKWPRLAHPDSWLLRRILDRCHALADEEDLTES
jgi:hypothetical protein